MYSVVHPDGGVLLSPQKEGILTPAAWMDPADVMLGETSQTQTVCVIWALDSALVFVR